MFETIFTNKKPIIGMVHLGPLPGSALYDRHKLGMDKILEKAVEEAKILEAAGVDGVQVENIWDIPFQKADQVSSECIAALAVAVAAVSKSVSIPVGVNCHFNAAEAALSCAIAGNAKWIRVFEWCNAFVSQVGFVDSIGAKVARKRTFLDARDIVTMCDANVKHGSHFIISDRSISEQAHDIEQQGGDVVIVTGFETGMAPTAEKVREIKNAVSIPVILGSGVTLENAKVLLGEADGAIVGSWFKVGNNWKNPVDYDRTFAFMQKVKELRGEMS